jgi:fructoselysine-6-P-deglycase FrlB-like protein
LQFGYQMVYLRKKVFLAGVRMLGEYGHRVISQAQLACLTGPTAHIAVSQQGKTPELIAAARMLQFGKKIIKTQLKA